MINPNMNLILLEPSVAQVSHSNTLEKLLPLYLVTQPIQSGCKLPSFSVAKGDSGILMKINLELFVCLLQSLVLDSWLTVIVTSGKVFFQEQIFEEKQETSFFTGIVLLNRTSSKKSHGQMDPESKENRALYLDKAYRVGSCKGQFIYTVWQFQRGGMDCCQSLHLFYYLSASFSSFTAMPLCPIQ